MTICVLSLCVAVAVLFRHASKQEEAMEAINSRLKILENQLRDYKNKV